MLTIVLIIHMLVALTLIGLILIQRGKGADIGAAFGSGASQTVFGSQGSASFLTRTTAILATVFFITSLSLGYLYSQRVEQKSVTDLMQQPAIEMPEAPATPSDVPVPAGSGEVSDMPMDVPVVPEHEAEPQAQPQE